jgi:hypothetical protein
MRSSSTVATTPEHRRHLFTRRERDSRVDNVEEVELEKTSMYSCSCKTTPEWRVCSPCPRPSPARKPGCKAQLRYQRWSSVRPAGWTEYLLAAQTVAVSTTMTSSRLSSGRAGRAHHAHGTRTGGPPYARADNTAHACKIGEALAVACYSQRSGTGYGQIASRSTCGTASEANGDNPANRQINQEKHIDLLSLGRTYSLRATEELTSDQDARHELTLRGSEKP